MRKAGNKKVIKTIVKRNLQAEKRRNIMLVVSIALASFLICFSGLIATSLMEVQKKQIQDTYEAVYMNVSEEKLSKLREEKGFERVLVMGEITTNAYVDVQRVVRKTIEDIGYNNGDYGFDAKTCAVLTAIDEQSTDIAMGVNKALEAKKHKMSEEELEVIGAGDQGMMFGYACDETMEYIPYPIYLAHKLVRRLSEVRKDGTLPYLRPDGKSQVTVEYSEDGVPLRLEAVVLSTQHNPEITQEQIHTDIKKYVFDPILPADMVDDETKFFINPTGRFVIGGPHGDSGLTGRKIIVDTYGG